MVCGEHTEGPGGIQGIGGSVGGGLAGAARVLEVAPGPGYLAIELAKIGNYRITGLDVSRTFVNMARRNAEEEGVEVDFRRGDAAHMPFEAETFDFIVCRAAFKNFARPVEALREMHRVLRLGGRALIVDLRKDASTEDIGAEVEKMGLSAINKAITMLTFRFMLLRRAYTGEEFRKFISQSGFRQSDIQRTPIGLEVALVK